MSAISDDRVDVNFTYDEVRSLLSMISYYMDRSGDVEPGKLQSILSKLGDVKFQKELNLYQYSKRG